mgnify:CR=1 FL=1
MQQDRIFQVAGLYVDKGEKAAQKECVKKLVKIHVEQPEDQPGEHDRTALPVFDRFKTLILNVGMALYCLVFLGIMLWQAFLA